MRDSAGLESVTQENLELVGSKTGMALPSFFPSPLPPLFADLTELEFF
jgi:hypothetical protein